MGKQSIKKSNRYTPEFLDWLKLKKLSIKRLQKNPVKLEQYYQEWTKTQDRPKKKPLLSLSNLNIDFDAIVNGIRIANEVLRRFQGPDGLPPPSKINS
ncbi:hypothetical protein BRE01_65480 [Brevibacillus reuszeri]|uniref:Uncharacterized protein n=1 Tax=Brevibacillus reuszeri TaxID=54915 RepID=A0A0K9Z0R8_9BACL|nr:hypothetical protein [Brevibacillus reuszeri]KNB74060.1 hypothetical protein ADS79_09145 [Brevibacillus reuszeri]MED1861642.1 hypothetical protein [Brevibacillus reuszeri]GED72846.1 hypothetical protein BRE01_65480 [Brevibacillus reuszeri]